MPRERREQRKLENSSWVLGQPKLGAISRKYEIILEKRQQYPLQVAPKGNRCGGEGVGEGREVHIRNFPPGSVVEAGATPQT